MIESLAFLEPSSEEPNLPFPEAVRNRPWVLYHGTSSVFEDEIEAEGLVPSASLFALEELRAVDSLFRAIKWHGITGASLPVLRAFSIAHDFREAKGRPVFFAECSLRACHYAVQDYAGGEAARALRYCFAELQEYVDNADLRASHASKQVRENESTGRSDLRPLGVSPTEVEDLRRRIEELGGLRRRAEELRERHEYGLVYAVEFSERDVASLAWHNAMGVKAFNPVPSSRLLGKSIVPAAWVPDWRSSVEYETLPSWKGILSHLRRE